MRTDEDATMMMKLIGLWQTRKWGNVVWLTGMALRSEQRAWYSKEMLDDMRLLRQIAISRS